MALSTIKTASIANDAVTADKIVNDGNLGNRNLIINGAMQVAQRGTSLTGQGASSIFLLDRFRMNTNGASAGRYTITQTTDGPSGLANCLKLDVTTADTSIAAGERLFIEHPFEGQNLQNIAKGTSDAQSLTLSFYVKGNAAATYVAGFYDNDNNRQVSKQFAVTTSWNRITLTFPPDTAGVLGDDNALSMQLRFYLHAGSNYTSGTISETWIAADGPKSVGSGTTSIFDSTSRTFFITGVQLEVGDTATPFEHRSFGDELARCQRYFQEYITYKLYFNGTNEPSSEVGNARPLPVVMRAVPTAGNKTATSGSAGAYSANDRSIRYLTVSSHGSGGFDVGFDLDAEL
jgi:hypothetical protein